MSWATVTVVVVFGASRLAMFPYSYSTAASVIVASWPASSCATCSVKAVCCHPRAVGRRYATAPSSPMNTTRSTYPNMGTPLHRDLSLGHIPSASTLDDPLPADQNTRLREHALGYEPRGSLDGALGGGRLNGETIWEGDV